LINLLTILDKEKFEVDLLVFNLRGLFADMVPKGINIVEVPSPLKEYWYQIHLAIKELFKLGMFRLIYYRLKWKVMELFKLNPSIISQRNYLSIKTYLLKLEGHYHAAIGFLDFAPTYFIIDKVKADIRIGWNHNDYRKLGPDISIEQNYISKLDYIVTVSEECKVILEEAHPENANKIKIIQNIIEPKLIIQMAENKNPFFNNFEGKRIVTIGRLVEQKGIDITILACKKLVESGFDIRWYIIGDGPERRKLEGLIAENGLKNNIFLLGEVKNPYPFVKNCDIYVQSSRYEAYGIAIAEAKVLQKPIVVTNLNVFSEQLINGKNGLIVNMSPEGIYNGIKLLLTNSSLSQKFSKELAKEEIGNESELEKVYCMVNGVL
ncbi:glycosyltransferase, partial [Neobacillus drentensis]|uniref:glycosyltransferase n=1 Tax=Neobacillus drentensis TaxID=220684 RepID=UPI002FFFDC1D